jgi:hypothetical protein
MVVNDYYFNLTNLRIELNKYRAIILYDFELKINWVELFCKKGGIYKGYDP